ncbi:MAG TPA: cysteine hydrolase [Syntrophales bacterium]|jgi:nicotinamidase-related amidase|nr:cysteine hydrolase [Syntrophales bacterium]HOU76812.1 cysteine hydrolase [Syntrophales bacterium]HPC32352.1 cysteine hydrolase [Syntrophales bacterium]HQG33597.1 cysteine hydrolase [Syntrophales bacterium]HQI34770.1 cysteine hydrolase [Syntrophales bacterium]
MKKLFPHNKRSGILGMILIGLTAAAPVTAATVIDEWGSVSVPAPPQLREVKLPAAATALLLLDFNRQVCNDERRPRCVASIPAVSRLLNAAREKGVLIVYSLTAGASVRDIAPELAARPDDPVVTSGPDKFLGTDLERILRDHRIKTVIVTGTAAHGAVISTAAGAAFRGLQVVLPVDGISAESLYPEQYTVWHLLNAPRVSAMTTVTKTGLIGFAGK